MIFILPFVFYLAQPINVYSQKNNKKANKLFKDALENYYQRNYLDAYGLLIESIKKDSTNINSYLLLSDVSLELKNYNKRIEALENVIRLEPSKNPIAYKYLAITYLSQGVFDKALSTITIYKQKGSFADSLEVDMLITKCKKCIDLINNPLDVEIVHLDTSINTSKNEYWPAISVNDSIFYFTRLINDNPSMAFERILFSKKEEERWSVARELNLGSADLENEGSICFSANGEWLFFTACGRQDGYGSCDIYYSQKINGDWTKPRNAGSTLNTSFWEAQPSISADGSTLFFSSNRKGSIGKKDIWISKIRYSKDREIYFSPPVNIGNSINTIENDYSPFIHADNKTLYFASDGWIGLGGADLFFSKNVNESWELAINMGFPINSRFEDDGLVVTPTANLAIFSSNRLESYFNSKDLFQLNLPIEFLPQKMGYCKGFVINKITNNKINATIEFIDLKNGEKQLIKSTRFDGYTMLVKENSSYALNICEPGYMLYSQHFNNEYLADFSDAVQQDIFLTPITDSAKVNLNNIFFNFDSYTLTQESFVEIKQLIHFLQINKGIKVEIAGHTDNSGTDEYNLVLSEKRAKAIYDELVKEISPLRLTFKGYGASKPAFSNDTEEGKIKNRRSELIVIID